MGKVCWVVSDLGNRENEQWVAYKSNLWKHKGQKRNTSAPISMQNYSPLVRANSASTPSLFLSRCRVLIAETQIGVAISQRHASVDFHPTVSLNAAAPYSCQIQETQRRPSNNKRLPPSVSVQTIVREDAGKGLSSVGGHQRWLLLLCCTELQKEVWIQCHFSELPVTS